MKKKEHSVSIVFTLMLFTIFALLSVLLIMIGSSVYGNVVASQAQNGNGRNALSYVTNKVRTCSDSSKIYIEEKDGVPVLVINGDNQNTLIFFHEGVLKEATIMAGDDYNLHFGETIASVDAFTFKINEETDMLKLTVNIDGSIKSIYVYIGAY